MPDAIIPVSLEVFSIKRVVRFDVTRGHPFSEQRSPWNKGAQAQIIYGAREFSNGDNHET